MTPIYIPSLMVDAERAVFRQLNEETPWLQETTARGECFMSPRVDGALSYTYGTGRGERTYTSIVMSQLVESLMRLVNGKLDELGLHEMNVCFLNRYGNERQSLGWHADDHPGTDHSRPIVSLSFGQEREIWWRKNPCLYCLGAGRLSSTHGDDTDHDTYVCPTCQGVKPVVERQLLRSGSMLVMPPGMQQTHQHRIPKGDRKMEPRISLTFRAFLQ